MNKIIRNTILIMFLMPYLVSQEYDTDSRQGLIISKEIIGDCEIEKRVHFQRIEIGNLFFGPTYKIYSDPYNRDELSNYELRMGQIINIKEIDAVKNMKSGEFAFYILFKTEDGYSGWIKNNIEKEYPYINGNYELIKTIKEDNYNEYSIRKYSSNKDYWLTKNSKIYETFESFLLGSKYRVENDKMVKIIAIAIKKRNDSYTSDNETYTLEKQLSINRRNDYWVQFIDEKGNTGWVFGGTIGFQWGGTKYFVPDNMIINMIGYY